MSVFTDVIILGFVAIVCYFLFFKKAKTGSKEMYQKACLNFKSRYVDTQSGLLRKALEGVYESATTFLNQSEIKMPAQSYDADVKLRFIFEIPLYISHYRIMLGGQNITDEEKDKIEQLIYYGSDLMREFCEIGDMNIFLAKREVALFIDEGEKVGCNLDIERITKGL